MIAGVIGSRKFIYDLWGDTVNLASRMESHGDRDRIQVSHEVFEKLDSSFSLEARGLIELKGRGRVNTYWLNRQKAEH